MGDVYMAKLAEQERTPALAHSRLPPLLINTKHPHWQAERYEEMVEYMKKVAVASDTDLSLEVRRAPSRTLAWHWAWALGLCRDAASCTRALLTPTLSLTLTPAPAPTPTPTLTPTLTHPDPNPDPKPNLNPRQERNLLSVAYKNVVGARRASLRIIGSIQNKEEGKGESEKVALISGYKTKVETELNTVQP